jgi:hypothetical protein
MIMENRSKITFFILLVILIGLGAGLFFSLKKLAKDKVVDSDNILFESDNAVETEEPVDMDALRVDYEEEIVNIVNDYEAALAGNPSDLENIEDPSSLKESLMAMIVPPEYRDLHLRLVLLFSEFEPGQSQDPENALRAIKNEYEWLK